jgi:hypothetical protein
MTGEAAEIRLKITYPVILAFVLAIHIVLMFLNGLPAFTLANFLPKEEPTTLKIRRVKTAEVKHSQIKAHDGVFNTGAAPAPIRSQKPQPKSPIALKDLAVENTSASGSPKTVQQRPGTRPVVMGLKSKELKEIAKSIPSGGLALSNTMAGTQKVSDAVVSIEVPDGIEPDELNKYELMFYSFQKRTAMNYINSVIKNLNKFQKTYPHYRLPTSKKLTMTARVTYDPQGNVMQIKMIRWTHVNEMQDMFENIVKEIDQLHNPPKALWEKQGEFSMFYTLEIANG